MVGCKVFVRWLHVAAQGLRQVENVVAVKESCALFKSGQHALFISIGVVFLYVGPPQSSYFVVDNYLLNIGKKMSSITNYVRCKQSPERLIVSLRSKRFRAV